MDLLDKKVGDLEVDLSLKGGEVVVTITFLAEKEIDPFLDGLAAKYPQMAFVINMIKAGADSAMV